MDEYPGNARTRRIETEKTTPPVEEIKLEQVVTGRVVRRKKSLGRRIKETLFSGDSSSVFGYLLKEVLVPALQATATDMVTQGIEKAIYGEVRTPSRTVRGNSMAPRTHISYNSQSSIVRPASSYSRQERRPVSRPSAVHIGDIILETKIDAQTVADKLYDIAETYNCVTVANLNELLGQTSEITDHKFGWMDLSDMAIRRVTAGWLLILPEPEDLR